MELILWSSVLLCLVQSGIFSGLNLALFGPQELWILLGILLLVFGARKLPQLARSMGSSITQFKRGLNENPDLLKEDSSEDGDKDNP